MVVMCKCTYFVRYTQKKCAFFFRTSPKKALRQTSESLYCPTLSTQDTICQLITTIERILAYGEVPGLKEVTLICALSGADAERYARGATLTRGGQASPWSKHVDRDKN